MEESSNNEVSLSIEETNKLRISLGLKPLRLDSEPSQANKERQNHEAKKQQEAAAQAQELRKKLEAAREKRLMDAKLKATKTLGAADGDDGDGDMAAWVEKNRRLEQQRREEAAAKAAAAADKAAAARNKRKKRDDEDDEEGGYKADQLAGLKVRHDLGEVMEGETVIVTLADKSLLDEQGNLREGDSGDELENTLLAEEKRRRKAMKASKKEAKPLWEEDGKVRTILDKYDEEEEEVVVAIGSGGQLEADRIRRQQDMRKKLAEGNAKLATFDDSGAAAGAAGGDYFTAAEMAAFSKPKKKKEKKERRIRARSVEPEPEGDILATLEAQAEEAGGAAADLGRRADRGAQLAAAEEAATAAAEQKRARFEAAVQKANWASQFLRNAKGGMAGAAAAAGGGKGAAIGEEDEEADRELRDSLERARRMAEKKKREEEEEAARKAEAAEAEAAGPGEDMDVEGEEKKERKPAAPKSGIAALFADIAAVKKEPEAAGGGGGAVLTETMEFVRNITAAPSKAAANAAKAANGAASPAPRDGAASVGGSAGARGAYADGDGSDLDDDDGAGDAKMGESGGGTWVAAADGGGGEGKAGREGSAGPAGGRGGSRERSAPPEDGVGITGERAVGRGLAGALGLLQDKGALKPGVEWSGRNTDRSKNALQGLDDVYTGGRQVDRVARSVEAALTVKDRFGRVLTPKERFRQLCHSFHGIKPSKNQVDKAAARDAKELAIKKAATSEDPSAELDRLRAVQRATGSAYVVLSGKNAGLPAMAAGGGGGGGDSDDEDTGRRGGGGGGGGRMKPPAPRPPGSKGGPPAGGPAFPLSGARGTIGNLTPLLGDRKVEAMLGIRKPGNK
ncbi:hypothetical protein CHLRE_03g156100v5 [Chlamydomonas reinhardtii]|uniref:SART-1 family protein n=1 Tax=Chlamydomonas reinhardtii TaxID=3055 RepID=A0A2K3DW25_CHLRE|nr:uncharacterized protein CHLRE_03g156100v5 [Chlamydomonas reinhardtii]PNW84722.1 hypothetical protein CHLRE_03g156100v5 [Chlamydomonas reinhardtii]